MFFFQKFTVIQFLLKSQLNSSLPLSSLTLLSKSLSTLKFHCPVTENSGQIITTLFTGHKHAFQSVCTPEHTTPPHPSELGQQPPQDMASMLEGLADPARGPEPACCVKVNYCLECVQQGKM